MAIQTGNMPAKGSMNNMSYYKSKDGIMVKMKSVISKEKLKTGNFEITHRNNLEFGLAGKAGKTLRYAVSNVIGYAKDGRLPSRLTTLMLKIAKTDTTSTHGERNVAKGQLEMLNGFNFNAAAPLELNFMAPHTVAIDRVTGKMTVNIPAFIPKDSLLVPEAATHFKLVSAGSELDFPGDTHITQEFTTGILLAGDAATAAVAIEHQLTANSTLPLFLFLGVQFFLEVNGTQYPIRNSNANAFAVVKLDAAI